MSSSAESIDDHVEGFHPCCAFSLLSEVYRGILSYFVNGCGIDTNLENQPSLCVPSEITWQNVHRTNSFWLVVRRAHVGFTLATPGKIRMNSKFPKQYMHTSNHWKIYFTSWHVLSSFAMLLIYFYFNHEYFKQNNW